MKTRILIIGFISIIVVLLIFIIGSNLAESKELTCLRLYKNISELSRTPEFALAEGEAIEKHRNWIFEYVEKDCPDFHDLKFIYNHYNENLSESESNPVQALISKSFAIFYAAEERGWTEEDFTKYDSHAILLEIKNDGFAFEVDPDTLEEKELYMNRFNQYDEGQYIWLVLLLTENEEYEYHIDASTGKILLAAQDGTVYVETKISLEKFEEIKSNMEKTGYGICDVQLERETIIIHLNWIFEDSEYEQEIISKIPDDIDYEIIYYDDYVDFSPQALREPHCDSLEIDDNNFPHVGEFLENEN